MQIKNRSIMKKLRLQITLALVLAIVLIGCEQHAADQVSPEEEIARDYEVDQEVETTSEPVAANEPMTLNLEVVPLEFNKEIAATKALQYAARQRIAEAVPPSTLQPGYNEETYERIVENAFKKAEDHPLSTFSIDVDAASYSNLRRFIRQGLAPQKDAVRIEEMINYFVYDYPEPDDEHPFSITTEVGAAPWNPAHQLVHIGLQGQRLRGDVVSTS